MHRLLRCLGLQIGVLSVIFNGSGRSCSGLATSSPRSEYAYDFGDAHVEHLADQPRAVGAGVEIDHPVVLGAALQFCSASFFDGPSTRMRCTVPTIASLMRAGVVVDRRLQALQPLQLDLVRGVVLQAGRRRAGARAEDEAEKLLSKPTSAISFIIASKSASVSPGKPTMKSDEMAMSGRTSRRAADDRLVFQRRVAALHRRQHPVRAVLHRQVQVVDQLAARVA